MKKILSILCLGSSLVSFAQFQVHTLQVSTNDLVYDSETNKIYASIPSSNGANGNSIGIINPNTYSLENTVYMGSEPTVLAISDNGQYIYSGFMGASIIRRFDIETQTAGLQFNLGADNSTGAFYAEDIEVMPGNPETIAVSRKNNGFSPRHEGVAIYDNGIVRENATADHTGSNVIEFTTENTLIGYNNESTEYGIRTLVVDSSGVTNTTVSQSILGGFYLDFIYNNNRMYATNGKVIDVSSSPSVAGQFTNVYGPAYYDEFNDFVCYATSDMSGTMMIKRFNPNTFLLEDEITLPLGIGEVKQIVGCGENCYAVNSSNDEVHIVNQSTDNITISEYEISNSLNLYPNPTTDLVNIDSDLEILEFELVDVNGKIILKQPFSSQLELTSVQQGLYILKCKVADGQILTKKLLKQ